MSNSKSLWRIFFMNCLLLSDVNASANQELKLEEVCASAKEWSMADVAKERQIPVSRLVEEFRKKQLSKEGALSLASGSAYALGNELVMSEDDEEYRFGVELLKKAARLGESGAISRLGMHYVNRTEAKEYGLNLIHCAAIKGRFDAAAFLGNYYGFNPGREPAKAPFYLELAVEVGVSLSQYQLAGMLLNGKYVDKDDVRALQLYKSAAAAGILQARYMYAYMLETGMGAAAPDYESAINWYLKAADSEWREGPPEAARLMHLIGQHTEAEELLRAEAEKNTIGSERAKELLDGLERMKLKR